MRTILTLLLLCAAGTFAQPVLSQGYPSRPVKLVVGFAPGGAADIAARAMQDAVSRSLGQPVVVENRPGAGSSIAAEYVAKSPADGYALLIASPSSILVNPILSPKAGFDPLKDLAPIGKVSTSPIRKVFAAFIAQDAKLWARMVKRSGTATELTPGAGVR